MLKGDEKWCMESQPEFLRVEGKDPLGVASSTDNHKTTEGPIEINPALSSILHIELAMT